jgi:hypothetical protein
VTIGRVLAHLGPLALGRPLHGPERYQPFFIVGSGRCGTTLLRAMLESHPDVHIPPGNPMLRRAIQEYRRYSRLPWSALLRVVLGNMAFHQSWEAFALPLGPTFRDLAERPPRARHLAGVIDAVYRAHTARHKPTARRWGDKSPLGVLALDGLAPVFPDLRVIYMLRDGRDVAASFVTAFGDDLSRATMVWLRAIRTAHAFRDRHPSQYLELRYEHLVREPQPNLLRVAEFLGLEFDERMLRHHELDLRLGDVDRTPYMQNVWKPVSADAIGRWRRDFTAAQIAELERALGPTLATLGYDGPSAR